MLLEDAEEKGGHMAGSNKIDSLVEMLREQLAFTEDLGSAMAIVEKRMAGFVPDLQDLLAAASEVILTKLGEIKTLNSLHDSQRGGKWYTGPDENGLWSKLKNYYISSEGKGWAPSDVDSMDDSSSEVVSLLDSPLLDSFSTRGLVVGYVQSGKTANMTAVITKAVDAGFRMIIILAGTTNKLREQTQKRLVEDVVQRSPGDWQLFTAEDQDYDPGTVSSLSSCSKAQPARLFVVKKNTTVLGKLLKVFQESEQALSSCPTLIIDDESDQASINASGSSDEITATNHLIRRILKVLRRVSYVGYTATPYANVLINPERNSEGKIDDDLYPRDFITALPRPESYFGAEKLFGRNAIDGDDEGEDGLDMVRPIPEAEASLVRPPSRGGDDFEPQIAPSLESALRWFIIATAAKGMPDSHSTMLIHVTHLVVAHERLSRTIERRLEQLRQDLKKGDAALESELKAQWENEYPRVDGAQFGNTARKWEEFRGAVVEVAEKAEVVVENAASENRIDYDSKPRTYIAIGGHVLARGLTMEGLISSYFLRTSRQYDTLMQMGRWFGFRRGYEELPRLWATEDVLNSFRELATVEAEIREDIAVYRKHNVSPLEFAVRIRQIPGMMVTARNKMTAAVVTNLSFDGRHLQILRYAEKDMGWLRNNWDAGAGLCDGVAGRGAGWKSGRRGRFSVGVPSSLVLSFLTKYRGHKEQGSIDLKVMREYIADTASCNGDVWSIGIVEPQRNVVRSSDSLGSAVGRVNTVNRAPLKIPEHMADIKALMSRQDLLIDMDDVEYGGQSWDGLKQIRKEKGGRPLLLLYAINRNSSSGSDNRRQMMADMDLLGFGIVFPGSDYSPKSYVQVDLSSFTDIEPEPEEQC